jgi:hypothetical protein
MRIFTVRTAAIILTVGLMSGLAAQQPAVAGVAFTATELLGRPTDSSVTVNAVADVDLEVYIEYGITPGLYTDQTAPQTFPGDDPIEIVLDNLQPDTLYYYRLCYREPGITAYDQRPEYSFRTQRQPGSAFTFTIQSDSHLYTSDGSELELYIRTLLNAAADDPDFHITLGDDFSMINVHNAAKARGRYFEQRPFLGLIGHSCPLFLVLGNHEDEEGWHLNGTANNVAIWGANARRLYYPNPIPGAFYSGNIHVEEFLDGDGLPEDYYAWEWGNALFVVLDPFRYTITDPDVSGDNWDWTLGEEQYQWFQKTLEESTSTFIFVFAHHLTGGSNPYGRGGAEAAPYFEWGGHNPDDSWGFNFNRPGWGMPIHQLMVANGVDLFFHGHDHVFVKQELDGIVYQETPLPNDDSYGFGHLDHGAGYESGDVLENSGHLRVTVSASNVTVDYVRAYLPGDGTNGEVAYTYSIDPVTYGVGSPPVADGKLAGRCALFTGNLADPELIHVTYGTSPCAGTKAVILYGNFADFNSYTASALDDAGSSGTALFDSTGMENVWFNIIWASEVTAGHPGYGFAGAVDVERYWNAAGLAGLTADDHADNSCD